MSEPRKRRIAILGGGQAALTTALQLTDPSNPAAADTDVTIYQLGWRLGGKGATGRGLPPGQPLPYEPGAGPARILEHGLHQWFGFYDNAIRQIRGVYTELARPAGAPLATFEEAFDGASTMYAVERIDDETLLWPLVAPVAPGTPGEDGMLLTTRQYLTLAIELIAEMLENSPLASLSHEEDHVLGRAHALFSAARHGRGLEELSAEAARDLIKSAAAIARLAEKDVLHPAAEEVRKLVGDVERELPDHVKLPHWIHHFQDVALAAVCALLHLFMSVMWHRVREDISTVAKTDERRFWIMANFVYTWIVGAVRGGVLEHGFDVLNDRDARAFMRANAFDDGDVMMSSPIVETIYVAAFAYPRGDTCGDLDYAPTENMEAGTTLRGMVRMTLTYKGYLCYRFAAGTGDTSYAPVYEVLRKRGVDVRFFSRIDGLELDGGRISRVHVAEQAQIVGDVPYEPLIDVAGLPCWPIEPCWNQLVDGDWFEEQDGSFEWPSPAMRLRERRVVLEDGRDYDDVVLGISIAALPAICGDLVEEYPAWKTALEEVKTVRTQSLQLWLDADAVQLGFPKVTKQSTGWRYDDVSALGAWNDFSELIGIEHWPADRTPANISYFTSTMPDYPDDPFADQQAADARVRENAMQMLRKGWNVLLPDVLDQDGQFRWELIVDPNPGPDPVTGPDLLATQWIRANVLPTERYVLSVVGSSRHRLPVHDPAGPANLYLSGDWTQCTLNCGCMEAATISGMLCANALSGYPARTAIVGVDF